MNEMFDTLKANGLMLQEDNQAPGDVMSRLLPHQFSVREEEVMDMLTRIASAQGHRFKLWTILAAVDAGVVRPGSLMMCFINEHDAIYAKMFL